MTPASGVVVGGWEYVWMAYGLTFSVLIIYGLSVVAKLRSEQPRSEEGELK